MGNCKPVCSLCKNLVISQSVTFTGGNLVINLPDNSFENGRKVCIIVAQSLPTATTINAPVYISIGTGGTELYPLVKRNCQQATACSIRARTKYCTCVVTTPTGGTFRLLGNVCPCPNNNLTAIDGTAPTAPTTPATE